MLGHCHLNGVANIVGVFADQFRELVLLQKHRIIFALGVFLDVHDNVGTHAVALSFGNGISVHTGGFPLPSLFFAVLFGRHSDGIRHHERRIKAHAELANNVHILVLFILFGHFLAETVRTGRGDHAQIVFQVLLAHTDAVVGDRQGPRFGIGFDLDLEVAPVHPHFVIGQRQIAQFILGIAGVGDQLPQENFLVGVDRVDHQIQQTLGFGFKLFLCHCVSTSTRLRPHAGTAGGAFIM